jgi:phage terminase large subunit-like protein
MALSLAQRFALLPKAERDAWIDEQEPWVVEEIARGEWWWTARPEQVPPPGSWLLALALCGRGWGKSRSGAEWLVERTQLYPMDRHGAPTEFLVVAETLSDARAICIEGPAGILRILERRGIPYRYKQSPKPLIIFPNGCKIHCEGADDADVGRGYNLAGAWLDEIVKWPRAYQSWFEGILPALRADLETDHPRVFATTTPKPSKLLKDWMDSDNGTVHVIRGSTFDNAENLSPQMLRILKDKYEGTNIGLQELYGEVLELMDGALFKMSDLEKYRVPEIPEDEIISAIYIGVDPSLASEGEEEAPTTGRKGGRSHDSHDEMGVVVVARCRSKHMYVLADESIKAAGKAAALHAWRVLLKWRADLIVCEENLGKKWMMDVFRDAWFELIELGEAPEGTSPPIVGIDAKVGKKTRAEPVAMRSEQGKLHMVEPTLAKLVNTVQTVNASKHLETLKDQLTTFTSWDGRESPDRLDAMVHACRQHMINERNQGKIIDPDQVNRDQRESRWDDGLGHGFDFGWGG